jgi:hypothetical protein
MYDIMSRRVRGNHAFRPSTQTRGAAASNPSFRKGKKAKEKAKAKAKAKEKEKETDIGGSDDELVVVTKPSASSKGKEIEIDGSDDEPVVVTKPSASTTDPIPIPFPSSASASSSKRKHSALGDDDTAASDSRTSYSSGKRKPRTTALDGVAESLNSISASIRELASERKLRRIQVEEARADSRHEQGGKAESPRRRHEAMQRVQQIETHLDPSRVMALVDLVAKDTIAADIYMSIEREDFRHAWVALTLKKMGFVDGISI